MVMGAGGVDDEELTGDTVEGDEDVEVDDEEVDELLDVEEEAGGVEDGDGSAVESGSAGTSEPSARSWEHRCAE